MNLLHRIGAVLAGIISGGLVVTAVEGANSLAHPMPEGVTLENKEELAKWISALPLSAFLGLLTAWAAGNLVGAFVARRCAPRRSAFPALIVVVFFSLATIWNLITIPHPWWLWFAGIAVCLIFGLLGLVLAAPRTYVVSTQRTINAPIQKVFRTLATVDEFSKAVPGITKVEFLTDKKYGVGTRFRETRIMQGKEAATELEVAELVEDELVRMVADAGGAIWDTIFRVTQDGDRVEMAMQMDARPHTWLARVVTPMILGVVSKAVDRDMDAVKQYCERP